MEKHCSTWSGDQEGSAWRFTLTESDVFFEFRIPEKCWSVNDKPNYAIPLDDIVIPGGVTGTWNTWNPNYHDLTWEMPRVDQIMLWMYLIITNLHRNKHKQYNFGVDRIFHLLQVSTGKIIWQNLNTRVITEPYPNTEKHKSRNAHLQSSNKETNLTCTPKFGLITC
jgi:hypothetical protein